MPTVLKNHAAHADVMGKTATPSVCVPLEDISVWDGCSAADCDAGEQDFFQACKRHYHAICSRHPNKNYVYVRMGIAPVRGTNRLHEHINTRNFVTGDRPFVALAPALSSG